MGRRQKVNILIAINGIGFVLCGAALAGVAKAGITPWYGLCGICFLFLGIVIPVYREFVGIRDSFDTVQQEAMRSIKHRRGDKNYQEIFDNNKGETPFKRVTNQMSPVLFMTIFGWSLMAIEGYFWITRA